MLCSRFCASGFVPASTRIRVCKITFRSACGPRWVSTQPQTRPLHSYGACLSTQLSKQRHLGTLLMGRGRTASSSSFRATSVISASMSEIPLNNASWGLTKVILYSSVHVTLRAKGFRLWGQEKHPALPVNGPYGCLTWDGVSNGCGMSDRPTVRVCLQHAQAGACVLVHHC